jgi:hypothetical protein
MDGERNNFDERQKCLVKAPKLLTNEKRLLIQNIKNTYPAMYPFFLINIIYMCFNGIYINI